MQSLLHIPRSLIFWKLFENIWLQRKRKKEMEEKKKREKKKHLEKKNIFFCGGIEKQRRKIFGPQRRRRTETEKEENLLEKENVTICDTHTDIVKKELELWTQISQKNSSICFFNGAVFSNILALLVCFCSSFDATKICEKMQQVG